MQPLLFEVRAGVATLTLNRPAQKNALDDAMRAQFAAAIAEVQRDRAIKAVVLTGAGGAFSAGGDLHSMAAMPHDNEAWRQRMKSAHAWLAELIALDRPVIAAVDGVAFGAGFSLALAADFIIATPRARLCMSFMRIGFAPDFGAYYTLPRVVGVQRAKELMLSARELGADEARALGIVMEIHPVEALLPRAQALAASFVHASPMAVSLIKRALGGVAHHDLQACLEIEATGQALLAGTAQHREAVQRFIDKQPALFHYPTLSEPA